MVAILALAKRLSNEELKLPALASVAAGSLRSPAALLMGAPQLNSGALDGPKEVRCHATILPI